MRAQVLASVHNLAHLGTPATKRLLSTRYVWRGMHQDCAAFVRDCLPCQHSKITRHMQVRPQAIPIPAPRFSISQFYSTHPGSSPSAWGTMTRRSMFSSSSPSLLLQSCSSSPLVVDLLVVPPRCGALHSPLQHRQQIRHQGARATTLGHPQHRRC